MKKLVVIFSILTLGLAHAQQTASLKIVVPNGVGSVSDTAIRIVAPLLEKELQKDVAIINLPGANGLIGQLRVAEANSPELLISNSTIVMNQILNKNLKVNIAEELEPIYGLVEGTHVAYVPTSSNIHSIEDLKNYYKNSGRILAGIAQKTNQLTTNKLSEVLNIPIEIIEYKLQTDMAINCSTNTIQLMVGPDASPLYKGLVDAGKLRVIATISEKRSLVFPDVRTIKEQGYQVIPTFSWTAFFVRKDTASKTKQELTVAIKKVMQSTELKTWASKPENYKLWQLNSSEIKVIQQKEAKYFESISLN